MTDRAKAVLAMEYLARQINNEDVFDGWLMVGVGDGDIPYGSIDVSDVDDYYLEDDNFKDLMTRFLQLMCQAYEDGGLYCGDIVSKDKGDCE